MESLVIKTPNSVKVYCKPMVRDMEGNVIEQTEEEIEQQLYQRLISDTERKAFDRNLISLLTNYLDKRFMTNWTNIQIKVSYSDEKHCEMNTINEKNIQWFTMDELKIDNEK